MRNCGLRIAECGMYCLAIVVAMAAVSSAPAEAKKKEQVALPEVAQPPAPAPDPGPDAAELQRRKVAAEVRAKLNGTNWTLDAAPVGAVDKSVKPFKDEFAFQDNKLSSKKFGAAGYSAAQYSVNMQGGTPTWETILRKGGEGTISLGGEVYGDKMNGTIIKRFDDPEKLVERFQFTGTKVEVSPPAAAQP